ncbi:TM2 domain-containing membrane protein YozV [Maribacter vaceletii]|uniref:TM2 domain-containing membrane protein YozV n=1 Tax=Maribacter vaceletii TaxID=1206816 RepID=A0A495EC99_9FLAO|nr:NINE protein [Maribacter vaceletii]RKR14446.1 TM2 domain-containing membrane protein YozV [Maribacter vaceletii]
MSEENKNLGDKAEDALDSAKEKAKDIGENASEKFDEAKEKASEFAEDAKEAAGDFADEAKKTANEFADSAKEAFGSAGGENKKVLAGLLAIFIGSLGIHKFILGYTKEGIIQVVATFLTCGAAGIIGLIEGIIYLTKTDEEFYNTYQVGKKPWF